MTTDLKLKDQIKTLYSKLQSGALTDADKITIGDVKFRDEGGVIKYCFSDQKMFQEQFAHFIPTYDIFQVFGDPGQVVLDVGAHSGYSVLAMRHHRCKATIVSVDAMPANIKALAVLKQLSGTGYDYVHKAISSGPGVLRLYLPVMNGYGLTGLTSTGTTLTDTFDGYVEHFAAEAAQYPSMLPSGDNDPRIAVLDIDAASLDDVFEARGDEVQRIVAVKLDLEGHEGPALRGAGRIFHRTRPLLMVEGANRDPIVAEVMLSYDYFHCERHDGCLTAHPEMSMMNDGFWVHPDRVDEYRRLGIFSGSVPH